MTASATNGPVCPEHPGGCCEEHPRGNPNRRFGPCRRCDAAKAAAAEWESTRKRQTSTDHASAERPWSTAATAEFLDVSIETLKDWRYLGKGPVFVKIGRNIGYLPSDIHEWLRAQRHTRTDVKAPAEPKQRAA